MGEEPRLSAEFEQRVAIATCMGVLFDVFLAMATPVAEGTTQNGVFASKRSLGSEKSILGRRGWSEF